MAWIRELCGIIKTNYKPLNTKNMTIDLSTFIFLGILFLAISYKHRKSNSDSESFHIAKWSAGSFSIIASMVALFGAGEIATFSDLYGNIGSGFLIFFIGASLGFISMYFWGSKLHNLIELKNSTVKKAYHINDIIFDRYGNVSQIIFTLLSIMALFSLYLIQIIVGSELIAIGTNIEYSYAVIAVSIFVAFYVILSGLDGIYSTDKIQLLALVVALIFIGSKSVNDFNVDISYEFTNVLKSLDFKTGVVLFLSGFFAAFGADVLQRYISSSSINDLKKISILSSIGWLVLGCILVVFSAGVQNYSVEENKGFIAFLSNAQGYSRVFIIVGLVCALLSTADTEAHSISLLANRMISPLKTPSVLLSRILIAVVCLTGAIVALVYKELTNLYVIMLNLFLIIGPIVIATLFKRGNNISIPITLLLSFFVLLYFGYSDLTNGTDMLNDISIIVLPAITFSNLLVKNK